jgi:hypothetical protein
VELDGPVRPWPPYEIIQQEEILLKTNLERTFLEELPLLASSD